MTILIHDTKDDLFSRKEINLEYRSCKYNQFWLHYFAIILDFTSIAKAGSIQPTSGQLKGSFLFQTIQEKNLYLFYVS